MTLREKLRRLDPAGRRAAAGPLPVAPVSTYDDPFALRTYTHNTESPHGEVWLQPAALDAEALAHITRTAGLAGVPPADWLFLDTETTGLNGGAGTVAFLVGLGRFDADRFVVRQYLMRDYPEEPAMLGAVEAAVADAGAVVTYNGKSFDVPLLRDRFALQRRRWPLEPVPHVDLLHTVRRLWRPRLRDGSLSTVERRLLGFERVNDLPGALVPERYFRALREQRPDLLDDVLEHNLHDILSLAALAVLATEVGRDPLRASAIEPEDLLHVGRTFERAGDAAYARAAACYAAAADSPVAEAAIDARCRLALLAKRQGNWSEAERVWRGLLEAEWPVAITALEELAKMCEHRTKDLAGAERWCRCALERLERAGRLRGRDPEVQQWEQRFAYRLRRVAARRTRWGV